MSPAARLFIWWSAIQAGAKLRPPRDRRSNDLLRARAHALGDCPLAHELLEQVAKRETELRNGDA